MNDDLKRLKDRTTAPAPAFFDDLSEAQLGELHAYVEAVVARETEGLDALYDTIASVMGYIPNFILLPLIRSTVTPAISAGVAARLSVKEASKLAAGLTPEYLAEVALHLESERAAEILSRLKRSLARQSIACGAEGHPAKTLDTLQYVDDDLLRSAAEAVDLLEHADAALLERYPELVERIRALEA